MFKRASKMTALALAAAAVVSLVPATGANAAAKRLGNKEGTVKEGIAFDGGKYSYYGFRSDEDLTGIYYNNGGDAKDTTSSDLDDYRYNTLSKYGTKYAYAHEDSNKDEYLIDLSTGKIVDDETKEEKKDKAETDLKSKIKKAERYNGTDDTHNWNLASFDQILQGQFGEVWFKYAAYGETTTSTSATPVVNSTKTLVGYQLEKEATVASDIYKYELAKLNGTTLPALPTYTVGTKTYEYDNGVANGYKFHTYADLVTLVKQQVRTQIVPKLTNVKYNEETKTTTTTAGGTNVITTVTATPVLFTADNVVKSGNYVGVEAAVSGKIGNIAGITNEKIGTIQDAANTVGGKVVYGVAQDNTVVDTEKFYGFSDESGKYIDASYTANMKVYSSTKGRAVMIDKYDEEDKDAKLTLHLESLDAVTQDKDNIYAIATVNVTGEGATKATQYFLQKISKAQGDKESGAYTPKSVTSYLLDTGVYKEGDLQKAYKVITGQASEGADEHEYLLGMTVKGSDLFVTRANKENVKVYKFNLKSSFKSDIELNGTGDLKTDVDTPAVKWDDASDTDINDDFTVVNEAEDKGLVGITAVRPNDDEDQVKLYNQPLYRHPAVSIDVNGNTWALKKNDITKFDGIDKKEDIYSVDGAMDAIDVYDDNSLIAWDTDGDRYTNIKEGTAVTEGDGINVNPDINKDKFKNGYDATEKKFYKDGKVVTNAWASEAGKWYFLDEAGVAKTGWYQNASGVWYLLGTDGAMLTGWQQDGGSWYYLNPVNTSGAMVTGWFQDVTGTWYYAGGNGKMVSNTVIDGYTLGANGAWVK